MSDVYDDGPVQEEPEPFISEGAADEPSLDSEIDFDDEHEDQAPLDIVEAIETGTLLDDPEALSEEDESL